VNVLRAVWEFVVDLIIGDDPKIAASVLLAVSVAAVLLVSGVSAGVVTVGGAALIVGAFTVSLWLDVRS
jgi:hypothetical protein